MEIVKNSSFHATGTPKSPLHHYIFTETLTHSQPWIKGCPQTKSTILWSKKRQLPSARQQQAQRWLTIESTRICRPHQARPRNRSEPETHIRSLQSLPLNSSVTFTKEQYISVNSSPNILNDIYRFCVLENSILRIYTTFELVDSITDATYTNESLLNESDTSWVSRSKFLAFQEESKEL